MLERKYLARVRCWTFGLWLNAQAVLMACAAKRPGCGR